MAGMEEGWKELLGKAASQCHLFGWVCLRCWGGETVLVNPLGGYILCISTSWPTDVEIYKTNMDEYYSLQYRIYILRMNASGIARVSLVQPMLCSITQQHISIQSILQAIQVSIKSRTKNRS